MKSDCRPWIRALREVLAQGRALIESLDVEAFAGTLPMSPGGSIGAHLRHVADFVQAFARDVRGGHVDYDRRERDERAEREPERMTRLLARLDADLERLARDEAAGGDGPLSVRMEASLAPGAPPLASSRERELAFLVSHTVHHFALIAMQLRARGCDPGPEFGVAASTLAHWAACAPHSG